MDGVLVWMLLLGGSALVGITIALMTSGRWGIYAAGAIPWFGLLVAILITEHVVPYEGGGASMWPIAQLVGGTIAAVTGVFAYRTTKRNRPGARSDT